MNEHEQASSSNGNAPVACDAFGADGALRSALLDGPVNGRRLTAVGAGTSARLGDVLGAGDTLLVFLRHLG